MLSQIALRADTKLRGGGMAGQVLLPSSEAGLLNGLHKKVPFLEQSPGSWRSPLTQWEVQACIRPMMGSASSRLSCTLHWLNHIYLASYLPIYPSIYLYCVGVCVCVFVTSVGGQVCVKNLQKSPILKLKMIMRHGFSMFQCFSSFLSSPFSLRMAPQWGVRQAYAYTYTYT